MVETTDKDLPATPGDDDEDPRGTSGSRHDDDEIDPELISLSAPRRTVGPILALSVIAFCVYIMVRLSPDFRFSRQSDSPRKIAEIRSLLDLDGVSPNDYVAVRVIPDYSSVFRIAKGEADYGHRVAPVVGTNGKLWLMVVATPWILDPSYNQVYAGRLRWIAALPFHDRLRDFVASQPPAPRVVDVAAVRAALEAGAGQVTDPFGDAIAIAPATTVVLAETVHDRGRIQAFKLEGDSLSDEPSWRAALMATGVLTEDGELVREDDQMVVYEVAAPHGIDELKARLIDAKLFRARAEVVVRRHDVVWSGLAARPTGLALDGVVVPWQNISSLALVVPRTLRSDALILMTAEQPGTYWYLLPVYAILALFILLFAWALVRGWQRRHPAPASDTPPAQTTRTPT